MNDNIIGPIVVVLIGLFACTVGMGCAPLRTDTQADANTISIGGLRNDFKEHVRNPYGDGAILEGMINSLSDELHEMKQEILMLQKFRANHAVRWPSLEKED